jgi:hypothetical protein
MFRQTCPAVRPRLEKVAAIIVTYINYVSRRHPYVTFETIIWAYDYEMILLDTLYSIYIYTYAVQLDYFVCVLVTFYEADNLGLSFYDLKIFFATQSIRSIYIPAKCQGSLQPN